MYEISVIQSFSAAHNLRAYRGKCEQLHGHNWQVEAIFGALNVDKTGMVIDFKVAKEMLNSVLCCFDHAYLNKTNYFKKVNPTSENTARFIFQNLARKVKKKKFRLLRVNVWETAGSKASYYE